MVEDVQIDRLGEYLKDNLTISIDKEYGFHLDGDDFELQVTLKLFDEVISEDTVIVRAGT